MPDIKNRLSSCGGLLFATDHGGFALKEKLRAHYETNGFLISDWGAYELKKDDDYPDIIYPAAEYLSKHLDMYRGVFLCANGVGASIVANRVSGIRAILGVDTKIIKEGRIHDDVNVLVLGGRTISFERAKKMISVFLKTKFDTKLRRRRRVKKIDDV